MGMAPGGLNTLQWMTPYTYKNMTVDGLLKKKKEI